MSMESASNNQKGFEEKGRFTKKMINPEKTIASIKFIL